MQGWKFNLYYNSTTYKKDETLGLAFRNLSLAPTRGKKRLFQGILSGNFCLELGIGSSESIFLFPNFSHTDKNNKPISYSLVC